MSIEDFPEILSQGILAGIILAGRLGAQSIARWIPGTRRQASAAALGFRV